MFHPHYQLLKIHRLHLVHLLHLPHHFQVGLGVPLGLWPQLIQLDLEVQYPLATQLPQLTQSALDHPVALEIPLGLWLQLIQ